MAAKNMDSLAKQIKCSYAMYIYDLTISNEMFHKVDIL